jgi:predicted transcriptional regulator
MQEGHFKRAFCIMKYSVLNYPHFSHYIRICGKNTDDALFLALLVEHHNKYYASRYPLSSEEVTELIGLSPTKARRCYKRLYDLGFVIKTVKKLPNGVPVNHYEVDAEKVNIAFQSR